MIFVTGLNTKGNADPAKDGQTAGDAGQLPISGQRQTVKGIFSPLIRSVSYDKNIRRTRMSKWNIDPDHSVGAFSIRHMTVAFVHGQLNKFSGTINLDPDNIASLDVEFDIEAESIITGIMKRADHLKSADFFDISKYPKISS